MPEQNELATDKRNWLWTLFFVLFAASFASVLLIVLFAKFPLVAAIAIMALAVFAWRLLGRLELSARAGYRVLFLFIVAAAALQLLIGYRLRFTPMWDFDAIFNGGAIWAETGSLYAESYYHGNYAEYFAMFQNQYGGLFVFRFIFGICRLFGSNHYDTAALVYNVAMIQVMVFAVYYAAVRLRGVRGGVFSLFLMGVFPPFYIMGAVYYTDALSMPFAAATFALYLRARGEANLKKKVLLFSLCGLAAAFGAAVKFTVMIVLIAVVIECFLEKGMPIAKRAACVAAAGLTAILCISGLNAYIDSKLAPELIDQRRIPKTHWIMMGLQGDGTYNPGDYAFTMSIPDLKTRSEETARVAWERAGELGAGGLLSLFCKKIAVNFGDGTFNMAMFLDDGPVHQSSLHEVVLSGGKYFDIYAHISTGYICAVFAAMLYGTVKIIRKRQLDEYVTFSVVPFLSLFGLLLFSLIWESASKMPFCFFPILVIGAVACPPASRFRFSSRACRESIYS